MFYGLQDAHTMENRICGLFWINMTMHKGDLKQDLTIFYVHLFSFLFFDELFFIFILLAIFLHQ
jgi:hypothetical protein